MRSLTVKWLVKISDFVTDTLTLCTQWNPRVSQRSVQWPKQSMAIIACFVGLEQWEYRQSYSRGDQQHENTYVNILAQRQFGFMWRPQSFSASTESVAAHAKVCPALKRVQCWAELAGESRSSARPPFLDPGTHWVLLWPIECQATHTLFLGYQIA